MNKFDPDALMKAQVERMKRAQAAAGAELRSAGRASDRNWRAEEAARGVLTQENPAALPFAILAEARRARELAEIAKGKESLADPEPAPQGEHASRRQGVVKPILDSRGWTTNKWGTLAGVGRSCPYDYLSGKRKLTDPNRKALADVLGLKPEDLPN